MGKLKEFLKRKDVVFSAHRYGNYKKTSLIFNSFGTNHAKMARIVKDTIS